MLEQSSSDFLLCNQLSAENFGNILRQLPTGLNKLKQLDIIRTDLKHKSWIQHSQRRIKYVAIFQVKFGRRRMKLKSTEEYKARTVVSFANINRIF